MKKVFVIAIAAVLALVLVIPSVVAATPEGLPDDATRLYKFNIIGVDTGTDYELAKQLTGDDNGKRMFVPLYDKCAILLQQAMNEDGTPMAYNDPGAFDIIDSNGTDGEATFQMPAPGYDAYIVGSTDEVWSDYSIYIRSLGKPGGWASITTCAELVDSTFGGLLPNATMNDITNKKSTINPDAYCSIEQVGQSITERPKGKSTFTNVTAELTSIVFSVWIDLDGDGVYENPDGTFDTDEMTMVRVPIFDDALQGEFWEYDNNGLKLLQVWIYDTPTNVAEDDGDLVPEPPVIPE